MMGVFIQRKALKTEGRPCEAQRKPTIEASEVCNLANSFISDF